MRRAGVALAAVALAPAAPALAGEAVLGVTQGAAPEVVRFDTAAPGALSFRAPVVGMISGESVTSVDQRPASGQIYLHTSLARILLLDPATGLLAQQGGQIDPVLFGFGQAGGIDFNPTVDRLRLVNVSADNLRWNPLTSAPVDSNTGTPALDADTDLLFAAGDPNVGANPDVVATAYDRSDNDGATPTTLYGVESGLDIVVRQGGVDGTPSPNLGDLFTLGGLGVNVDSTASLDIAGPAVGAGAGTAWAAMRPVGQTASTLYTLNLAEGAAGNRATAVGTIGGAPLAGMTVLRGGAIRGLTPPPAGEGAGQMVVRVERVGEALEPASLAYRTVDRTAVAGRDYGAVAGTIDLARGQRSADVAIPLLQDSTVEPGEALALELGAPTGGAVLDTPVVTVEIADDDAASAVPPRDTTRPGYRQTVRRPKSLAALRRARLLRVRVTCTEACTVRLVLNLKGIRLGTGRATLAAAGSRTATVRLSRAGRRALIGPSRRTGRATLALRATATDPAGNATARRAAIGLSRR